MKEFTRIARALSDWSPGEGQPNPSADPLMLLAAGWPDIVGEEVARNSHPVALSGTALVVATRSSAWSQQLSFLSEEIVGAVRARLSGVAITQLRFRVGRLPSRVPAPTGKASASGRRAGTKRSRAETGSLEEALERFRSDVDAAQRAKRASGWKECLGCSALIAPDAGRRCVSCEVAQDDERARLVARLLFEAPWLGYAGTARLVERYHREGGAESQAQEARSGQSRDAMVLSQDEYESIRRRLLARWWETLSRATAAKRLSRDNRERLIASSYVILKSGLPPERIVPATVRNVLGDALHELLYETERIADH